MFRISIFVSCLALTAGASLGADEIVESVPGPTFQYGPSVNAQQVTFTTAMAITGVGLTGDWSSISGDLSGGSYPWPLDLQVNLTTPESEEAVWQAPFTGDVSIGDFPINDGSGPLLSGESAPGVYTFGFFDTINQPNALSEIANPVYHAMTTVPDVTYTYTATPDPKQVWDRPFFLGGVSGLGPTRYHVLEFSVDTAGRYDFTSILSTGGNHISFIYKGTFDDALPLENIFDYGLGNGFGAFGQPQGESGFSTLLFPGETYYWVTSTWQSSSPLVDSANTIVGPGVVTEVPDFCLSDFDKDGDVDLGDFGVFGAAFNSTTGDANYDARADFDNDGDVDLGDFGFFGSQFGLAECAV